MTDRTALFEIRMTDGDDFRAAVEQFGLDARNEGQIERFDGAGALAFAVTIAPAVLDIAKTMLEHWLGRRKMITVRVGGVVVETDSPDELDRIIDALQGKPVED